MGILGGTFDPPHLGHLIVACEALEQLGLDELRLIPARMPPHKPGGAHGGARQRLEWTRALVGGHHGLSVSDEELVRPGPSYSADTVAAIAARSPSASLWFVLGADQLASLRRWHQPARLLEHARIAAVPRSGFDPDRIRTVALEVAPGHVDIVDAPRVDISSTLIRSRLLAGRSVEHLTGSEVHRLLIRDGLVASRHPQR